MWICFKMGREEFIKDLFWKVEKFKNGKSEWSQGNILKDN